MSSIFPGLPWRLQGSKKTKPQLASWLNYLKPPFVLNIKILKFIVWPHAKHARATLQVSLKKSSIKDYLHTWWSKVVGRNLDELVKEVEYVLFYLLAYWMRLSPWVKGNSFIGIMSKLTDLPNMIDNHHVCHKYKWVCHNSSSILDKRQSRIKNNCQDKVCWQI